MRDDNLRPMWSENELDAALAALRSDVDMEEDTLTAARAELIAEAGGPTEPGKTMTMTTQAPVSYEEQPARRRHRGRWLASAAAIAALADRQVRNQRQGSVEVRADLRRATPSTSRGPPTRRTSSPAGPR